MSDEEDFFDEIIDDEADESDSDLMMDEELDEEVELRTVLMMKNDMIALLGLKVASEGGFIIRIDPRQSSPVAKEYADAAEATAWFGRTITTSKGNGWNVLYDGPPLFG
jgi:hypothetical protein